MSDFQGIIDAWNTPEMRHAMLGHLPIALAVLGLPLALASALAPKNRTLRVLAILCYLIMVIATLMTLNSGEQAHAAIENVLTPNVYELIERHEDMADQVWLFAAGMVGLLAASALPRPAIRVTVSALAVLVGAGLIGWIAVTAHLGGTLVYTYGVGTPQPVACYEVEGVQVDGRDHAAERRAAGDEIANPASALPSSDAAAEGEDASDAGAQPPDAEAQPPAAAEAQLAFFRTEVAPILTSRCLNCHNPSRARRSGRLDQTTRETLLAGGRSGPAIVLGDPEASLLIHRVRGDNLEEDPMPPPPRDRLTAEEIAALEQWIRDGAAWDEEAMTVNQPAAQPPPEAPSSE